MAASTSISFSLLLLFLPFCIANYAIFSDPVQALFAGQSLTDGNLTLTLYDNCSLILYENGVQVLDFQKATATSHCALMFDPYGRLVLIPDNTRASTGVIGSLSTGSGRYVLLLRNGKLVIYGPAIFSNGLGLSHSVRHANSKPIVRTDEDVNSIIYSGKKAEADPNGGDVVIAHHRGVSAVLRPGCSLAVVDELLKLTIWETYSTHTVQGKCFIEFRPDGEILLVDRVLMNDTSYGAFSYRVWGSSVTSVEKEYIGAFRQNGEIVVYGVKDVLYGGKKDQEKNMMANIA